MTERFWPKVDKSGECWLWTGSRNGWNYGKLMFRQGKVSVSVMAHRASWELHYEVACLATTTLSVDGNS